MTCRRALDDRKRLYALLAVARRELGMEEEDYRALLRRLGAQERNGRPSAATMSLGQLRAVLAEMERMGFRRRGPDRAQFWRAPRIRKITALWCALADAGVVRDRSEAAMQRWCARLTGTARLEWAGTEGLNACIEGLKRWAWREHVPVE